MKDPGVLIHSSNEFCTVWGLEISYLSMRSRKVQANLTVLYLQLISDKIVGETNDINSDEVKCAINQIHTGKKFNF